MRAGFRKIALIGGSGKVGRYIPEYAAAQGLQVRMLIRNPAKISYTDSRIELIQGDAQNRESLLETLQGCDVVVNTLGQPEREPNPIYSKVTAELVSVMQELDIQRYMGVTGGSLTLEGDRKSLLNRIGTRMFRLLYPAMMEDKAREVRVLQASSLDWTLFRLPFVQEKPPLGRVRVSLHDLPGRTITNYDIAEYIIRQLDQERFRRKLPFISN